MLLAQLADIVTKQIALGRGSFVEENGVLMSLILGRTIGSVILKLGAIVALLALGLVRLPAYQARIAASLALTLSVIGPVLNVSALLLGR